ncbi:MAG: hypothetical protein AB8F26_01520 [Phycisphaerales bacterium]
MNESIVKQLGFRLFLAAAAVGGLWIGLVKPAQADLASDQRRLALQQQEIMAFESDDSGASMLAETIERIRSESELLESGLTRQSGASAGMAQIENAASKFDIRVRRSDPGGSVELKAPDSVAEAPLIYADSYTIDFSGTFRDVTFFLHELQTEYGLVDIPFFRLNPVGSNRVVSSMEVVQYRLGKGESIVGSVSDEKDQDEN